MRFFYNTRAKKLLLKYRGYQVYKWCFKQKNDSIEYQRVTAKMHFVGKSPLHVRIFSV
jgi:hypothetical protein